MTTKLEVEVETKVTRTAVDTAGTGEKPVWETPRMEDVSNEVMAQPYIRFT
jgi:hypothetical protein